MSGLSILLAVGGGEKLQLLLVLWSTLQLQRIEQQHMCLTILASRHDLGFEFGNSETVFK